MLPAPGSGVFQYGFCSASSAPSPPNRGNFLRAWVRGVIPEFLGSLILDKNRHLRFTISENEYQFKTNLNLENRYSPDSGVGGVFITALC